MSRYRLLKRPTFLDFRNGRVQFYFHRTEGFEWCFRAVAAPDWRTIVIFTADHQTSFDDALATGFDVAAGGAGERMMDTLVKHGYAERLDA